MRPFASPRAHAKPGIKKTAMLKATKNLWHYVIPYASALWYGFPSRKLFVVGVTGTKGKSSTTEMVSAVLTEGGYTTAVLNSIRVKIAGHSEANLMRMSMPGRFYIQRFLSQAVKAGCTAAIIEMTSQGAEQHRHHGISMDALIFTNLAPEHIAAHGSFEAYGNAKFMLAKHLMRSAKRPRIIVANADDPESARYLVLPAEKSLPFSLSTTAHSANDTGGHVTFDGVEIETTLPGDFSLMNALAAATLGKALSISADAIARGIAKVTHIPGRAERLEEGQDFAVIVDYAHTPDSLQAIYKAYAGKRKICVLGSMGGSRDTWNRPVKGKIAGEECAEVILTDEDPCDDDPMAIIKQIAEGVGKEHRVILDRREAIREALKLARAGDAVLITGKGTDPWIYGAHGAKIPWSDATIAREELRTLLRK